MSLDAGGLAQMTYQPPFNNSIGVSGPGFGSRGKAGHIKRLSVAPPSSISTIDEGQQMNNVNIASTPRTARGHLLAGLRTAPKSATVPSSNSSLGLESSRYANSQYERTPQTTTATTFPTNIPLKTGNNSFQGYSMPEQVLAPPTFDAHNKSGIMDKNIYEDFIATQNYLAQQQRALQQQLLNIQQAAQQLGGMNINGGNYGGQMQQMQNSQSSIYSQQCQQGLQPIVQPVAGNPGVFAVYNPMTGQSSFVVDHAAAQQQQQEGLPTRASHSMSPPPVSNFQRHSPDSVLGPNGIRSRTPPKSTPSPQQDVEPLPPPSANAFRRGHKKSLSSVNIKSTSEWIRTSGPKSAGIPTPMTGTFGPGQARAGEHPVRQPRGPPLIQELQEKPTSKHEGSKNFATRQRRRAVHDLVRAGRERTESRQPGSGTGTPGSEAEFNFSGSDNDELMARSTSLSSKPSLGSLRAAASGAIGSERKEKSRERASVDSIGACSTKSLSSEDGNSVGGQIVEVENTRRKAPLFVLSSAEKRKSFAM